MAHQFMPVYNIDSPVGDGETNAPNDVKLIQLLFSELNRVAPTAFIGLPALPTDGRYSPLLRQWIHAFQRYIPTLGRDGKIHPIRSSDGHFTTNIGRHRSTMLVLNYNLVDKNAIAHRRVAEAMRLPIRLHLHG